MLTILSIIGARPQFIKHAPVQAQLIQHFNALTLHTGQHYDANMSQVFFDELQIPKPDYLLDVSKQKSQSEQTGRMMSGIEEVCTALRPEAILLYGDTNSTLAGALVGAKMGIPIIHVEAGIRSYNRSMAEEVNRIVADTFSSILCCPIPEAVENLQKEGITHDGVYLTGDVMCDILERSRSRINIPLPGPYYFCTIHRPYNTDVPQRMRLLLHTLNRLDHEVIFAIHPRTRRRIEQMDLPPEQFGNIRFIDPIGYLDSLSYQYGASCVITDSGGIQKEAYMLRKKCLTLRSETEWKETLAHGWNRLVFDDIQSIVELVHEAPGDYVEHMFGEGHAAEAIVQAIKEYLGNKYDYTSDHQVYNA